MPLVYLPDAEALFLWGEEPSPRSLLALGRDGEAWSTMLVAPEGRRETQGVKLSLFETTARLAVVPAAEVESLPGSIATWTLASKLAMDLVARERVVPTIARRGGSIEARWAAALSGAEDAAKIAALGRSMPPAAHAVPASLDGADTVWAPISTDFAIGGLRSAKGLGFQRVGRPCSLVWGSTARLRAFSADCARADR